MVFPLFVLSEKVKIAAFPAAAQGPGPGEADLPETVVGPVVRLTEQAAQFPAAALHAGPVPETARNGHIEEIPTGPLGAVPQVGGGHDLPEKEAVKVKKIRGLFPCEP